jgi:hypothetical protein
MSLQRSLASCMSRLAAVLLVAVALGADAQQQDERALRATLRDEAARLFERGDFATLEARYMSYVHGKQRTPSGLTYVEAFDDGIDDIIDGPKTATEAYFRQLELLTKVWAQSHPLSPLAHDLHARALSKRGWYHRGTGMSNTVAPDAWAPFRRYQKQSADYLLGPGKAALQHGIGHSNLISRGLELDWPRDHLAAIAADGLKQNPDADDIHYRLLRGLLPKWGGSAVLVDRYINAVVEKTQAKDGTLWYSRLYAYAANQDFSHQLFQDSLAEWPKMKRSLEDLVAKYPDPYNTNRFAYFACLAREKETFLSLMDRIGKNFIVDRWGTNPQQTMDSCRRWASTT